MIKKLGNYFITGIIIALPIAVTIFVFMVLIRNVGTPVSQTVFVPLFRNLDAALPHSGLGIAMLDLLSTLVVVLFITALGIASKFLLARWIIDAGERVINKIPVVGVVYRTVKQIVDTFSKQNKAVFQAAVMVEFPSKGLRSIGFLTGEAKGEIRERTGGDYANVFVPTTPNPTSGFLIVVPKSEIVYLDMTVGEAMKLIISGGAVAPEAKKSGK